jgi:hypothetical protein
MPNLTHDTTAKETVIDDIHDTVKYSLYTLTAEISRYMNTSPILINRILSEAVDGLEKILELSNKHNDIITDVIIPTIFSTLYNVKSEITPTVSTTFLRLTKYCLNTTSRIWEVENGY